MSEVNLEKYMEFVATVTSNESNNTEAFIQRVRDLESNGIMVSLLMTASTGLSAEGGEFSEIVKKTIFQGKPLTPESRYHMKKELGDIIWYWVNACRALGYDPNDVIGENVTKLENRYPGGKFDVFYSENRKEGDI